MPDDVGFAYLLSIDLAALEHLGINLYSNIPAVLSEIVANSYDADAQLVDIEIDEEKDCIIVTDDGNGMSRQDINDKYLRIAYKKREAGETTTPKGRHVMGRKGIGKLAPFSIAKTVEVHSVKTMNGQTLKSGFIMNLDDIKAAIENKQGGYEPKPIPDESIDVTMGTRIELRDIEKRMDRTEHFLRTRLARRFSIIGAANGFSVRVNGEPITVEDRGYFDALEHIWYFGERSSHYGDLAVNAKSRTALEPIVDSENNYSTTGWIGTVGAQKNIKDGNNSIVVLAWGKLIHEDILKDMKSAGVYASYVIGEVRADFLDADDKSDIATSSRQSLKEGDPRFDKLLAFVRNNMNKIGNDWKEHRQRRATLEALENTAVKEWYDALSKESKRWAERLFAVIETFPIEDVETKNNFYANGIMAFESLAMRDLLNELDTVDANQDYSLLARLTGSVENLEAAHYYRIVDNRLKVLKKLETLSSPSVKEAFLRDHIFDYLWLLDPSWERASTDPRRETIFDKAFDSVTNTLTNEERLARVDIKYRTAAGKHIVIELKRYDRTIQIGELVDQVRKYKNAIIKVLQENYPSDQKQFEIICLLGTSPEPKETDEDNRKELAVHSARYITFDELIDKTRISYADYLETNAKLSRITTIVDSLRSQSSKATLP